MLDRTIAYGLDFYFPAGDTAVGANLAVYGEFARPAVDLLSAYAELHPSGTLLDVGANIGAICLPFAAQNPQWNVVAVEAHRGLAGLLSTNVTINKLANVEVLQAAAAAARGVAQFPAPRLTGIQNFGALSMLGSAEDTVPVLTLPVDEFAPPDTRLVKVDVEGYEPHVLDGATSLLASHSAVWLVEATAKYPQASSAIIETFLQLGYAVHWFFAPFASAAPPKARNPTEIGRGDVNVVALPRGIENIWGLPSVSSPRDARPSSASEYAYLQRYGIA